MRCASCGFDNREGLKVCGERAAPGTRRCPRCGFENPPRFEFCGERAAGLAARTPSARSGPDGAAESPRQDPPPPFAERMVAAGEAHQTRADCWFTRGASTRAS